MKKVYFACSIRGGREDSATYAELVKIIAKNGQVLSELFGSEETPHAAQQPLSDAEIYQRDMDWLSSADCMIAEVTTPSLGVGYELSKAEDRGIPILALFRPENGKKLSAMIAGSPKINVHEYKSVTELDQIVSDFMQSL